MQLNKVFFLFIISAMLVIPAIAQKDTSNTVATAKTYIENNKIKEAKQLLTDFIVQNPNNLNGLWLYAQTCYWLNDFSKSREVYSNAMEVFPQNYNLKLDYAKVLVNMGYYKQAEQLLQTYLLYDPKNIESQYYLALLNYWQGKNNIATKFVNKVLKEAPKYPEAIKLKKEIAFSKAPKLEFTSIYYTDDQPMKFLSNSILLEKDFGSLFSPSIQLTNQLFNVDNSTLSANQILLGNLFNLSSIGTTIRLHSGVVIAPTTKTNFIGSVEVDKKIYKYFSLSISAQRFQYFYTTKSINSNVLPTKIATSTSYDNSKIATIKIAYERNYFEGNNKVSTMYAWVLGPSIKVSIFELKLGYAFSNNTSAQNLYTPKQSISEIIAAGASSSIPGYYAPYFTPSNQISHSILANVKASLSKNLSLSVNSNIGATASIDNPYFFINENAGSLIIEKGFYKAKYSPLQINTVAQYNINNKIGLNATYSFNKTFFFTSTNVELGIKCNLYRERKRK